MARIVSRAYVPGGEPVTNYVVRGCRSVKIGMDYQAVDATKAFAACLSSFSYTDEAAGNSDHISMTCDNIDGRFGNGWFPNKYDCVKPSIIYLPSEGQDITYPCGSFYVDDVELTWPDRSVSFEAVSKPIKQDFAVTVRSKVWNNVTLLKIAQEITERAGVSLVFEAADTSIIESVEQSKQTDSDFLVKLCGDYGKKMKVYADKVIIYDIAVYEAKESVLTIDSLNGASVSWKSSAQGTYTGARLAYTNSKKNKTIDVSVGTTERLLVLNESVKTEAEALEKARIALNEANRKEITASISLVLPRFLSACSVVTLEGFGDVVDGRYFVSKVTYTANNSGFSEQLEVYKIPELIS